jgi:O-antigen/teichoic acid export membrane protein
MRTGRHFRELRKDVLTYGFLSALNQMSGVLLLPILTRVLSVDDYGTVDIIATFVSLVAIGLRLALPNALTRYYHDTEGNQARSQLVSSMLAFVATVGLVAVAAVYVSAGWLAKALLDSGDHADLIRIGGWIALATALASIPLTTLRMERRIVAYNVPTLLSTILHVALALYFVVGLGSGVQGVFWARLLSSAALLIVSLWLARRHFATTISIPRLRRSLTYSLPLLPGLLSVWVNQQAGRLILLFFSGLAGVAVFGAASRIVQVINFVLIAFQQAWMPYSMIIIKTPERNEVYRRAFNYHSGGFACLALALTAVSPELLAILVPADYRHGYVVVPWLVGALVISHSRSFTKLGVMIGEKTAGISLAAWVGVVLNVVLALALIPPFGIAGASIAVFVAEVVVTGLLWRNTVKHSEIRFDTTPLVVVLVTYIVASASLVAVAQSMVGVLAIVCRLSVLLVAVILIASLTIDKAVWLFIGRSFKRAGRP